jgi:hypothetical protein
VHTEDFTQANEVQKLLGRLRSTCEGKQFSDVPERANPHLALVDGGCLDADQGRVPQYGAALLGRLRQRKSGNVR